MSTEPTQSGPPGSRLRAELNAKVATWLGLAIGICVPYFALQQVTLFPVRSVPQTAIDRWIGFEPGWIYAYISIALLVPLGPLMAVNRPQLHRYAVGLALLCVPCFLVFLVLPVEGPRPVEGAAIGGLYGVIVGVDRSTNSMPSLHAGLSLYSILYGARVLENALHARARVVYALVGSLWIGLILYSTVATRQHWVVDLPVGLGVAYMAHRIAWRRAESH